MSNIARVQAGCPAGGQFATRQRDEAVLVLDAGVQPAPAMDLDEAREWWYEDGSYAITAAAVGMRGGMSGWDADSLPPTASPAAAAMQAEARSAAVALMEAAERFDEPVSHGTGAVWAESVGGVVDIPLMATTTDAETASYFAASRSEDGTGSYLDFPDGAVGVAINDTERVVTGRYRVDDVVTDATGARRLVLRPV